MYIFFDWDGVLFDIQKFKEEFRRVFVDEFKLSSEDYKNTYNRSKQTLNGVSNYVFSNHLDILKKEFGLSGEFVRKSIFNIEMEKFLYNDVEENLRKLRNKGYKLVVLTFGSKEIQNMKIDGVGIRRYFDDILITVGDKGEVINKYVDSNQIKESCFVDDKVENLQIVQATNEDVKLYFMSRNCLDNIERLDNINNNFTKICNLDEFYNKLI